MKTQINAHPCRLIGTFVDSSKVSIYNMSRVMRKPTFCICENKDHYVNVSVLIKFSQKTSVFTLIIISSP